MQIRESPEATIFFFLNVIYVFNSADENKIMTLIQCDVIVTSLPVEVLLFIESSPEQRRIILLQPYKILETFLDKLRNYTNFKKRSTFF